MAALASKRNLRGGWSLDLNHTDPVTGLKWDLSNSDVQAKVRKVETREAVGYWIVSGVHSVRRATELAENGDSVR